MQILELAEVETPNNRATPAKGISNFLYQSLRYL
jgi:hypothetical protein